MRDGRTTVSADPFAAPRAANGRAPDVFKRGGWVAMRQYSEDEAVDFVIIGTGAGGGPLLAGLAAVSYTHLDVYKRQAWDEALAADRPVILECYTDPNVPPLPPHITLELSLIHI